MAEAAVEDWTFSLHDLKTEDETGDKPPLRRLHRSMTEAARLGVELARDRVEMGAAHHLTRQQVAETMA